MAPFSEKRYRRTYHLKNFGFPEVPLFGVYRNDRADTPLGMHSHPGFEICFLAEGRQVYSVGGRDYLLKRRDIFMTLPGERHSSGKQPQEKGALFWMYLSPARRLLGLSGDSGAELLRALYAVREKRFPGNEKMPRLLEHVHTLLELPPNGLRRIDLANTLVAFLLELVQCAGSTRQEGDKGMEKIIRYIMENLEEPLRVPELASRMNLSESWFKTRFKQETGLSPADYVMRQKIAAAREFLAKGEGNVTAAAMKFGFYSSQHFAKTFRKYTNQKPSEAMGKS